MCPEACIRSAPFCRKSQTNNNRIFHFDYSSNAAIYVLDVTDLNDVKPLVTINPVDDIALTEAFTGANSADVLLHPTDECLELYVVNSGRAVIGKYKIVF